MSADPYKYFRIEARELLEGLSRGALELEKGEAGKELVGRLLRQAHTLKGASRVVKQPAIGDLAHAIEDVLAPFREGHATVPRERVNEVLKLLDAIARKVTLLEGEGGMKSSDKVVPERGTKPSDRIVPETVPPEIAETVRVELGEMDSLLESVSETSARVSALEREARKLEGLARAAARLEGELGRGGDPRLLGLAEDLGRSLSSVRRSLDQRLEESGRELLQVREKVNRLRLLPAAAIFAPLERAVRDAAQSVGKRVEFHASGGETRLDVHVLGALRDALLHVVRNSVAHGIEPEADRLSAGKPPAGRVELTVERRGNRVTIGCRDDGRGIDVEAVRKAALRKGLLSPAKASSMPAADVVRLILTGGVTTTGEVTEVAGRGVGLDVLREAADRLKGEVAIRTERGKGTTVEITAPVSLSSLPALLVEAAGTTAAIPLDAVPGTRLISESDVARSSDGDSVIHDGKGIPFVPLSRLLGAKGPPAGPRKAWSAVIVRSAEGSVALGVERVLGTSSVVVRPLPAWLGAEAVVFGAALDADGSPQLVLDPPGLVRTALAAGGRGEARAPARPPILVVDDSLTTRMLEQSILESSGYDVDLATSGEEGLARARKRRYGLFLVDVEMPGMDGFDFIARARSDPALRETPSILVTSRGSEEDRRRGEQTGALAYIVKSDFDQGRLLDIIRNVIG